jgi:hypothetical protein
MLEEKDGWNKYAELVLKGLKKIDMLDEKLDLLTVKMAKHEGILIAVAALISVFLSSGIAILAAIIQRSK